MGMRGVYLEIVPPGRLVSTESFDDFPNESVNTMILAEHEGKTTLTATVQCEFREILDPLIKSGMKHGAAETYDRLAEMLTAAGSGAIERGTGAS
jgi:uncharacterized protein YndB with AHSA1/START domain